jgi:peroxiredoxin
MKPILVVLLFIPAALWGQTTTEKLILEEMQQLNQRMERIEKKLEEKPSLTSSYSDPEKKVFGMHLTRGPKGNRVTSVIQGSPADKSGVRPGDLVTLLDGKNVTSLSSQELLRELDKKDMFTLVLEPKTGEKREVKITKARQGDLVNERGGFALVGGDLPLSEAAVGQPAPEITAKDSIGNEIRLSSLKGKVVLVNFTATWCGPCKEELPDLVKLYNECHDKGLEIISVFLDSDRLAVERHVKDHRILWPYAFDGKGWDNDAAREWGISAVPTNPIIDKRGVIAEDNVRGVSIQRAVEKYLK